MTGPGGQGRPGSALARRSKATIRLGLRLAARNAIRAGGRSVLIVALIALPVLALSATGTVVLSMQGTVAQTIRAPLGNMAASLVVEARRVVQTPEGTAPDEYGSSRSTPVRDWVPSRWRLVPLAQAQLYLRTAHGVASIAGEAGDSWDRAFAGRFELVSGRAPTSADEVLVSPAALARFGTRVGGTIQGADGGRRYTVVGTMRDLTLPSSAQVVFGQFAAFPGVHPTTDYSTSWYLAGPPVTWADVLYLNGHGALVLSRAATAGIDTPDPAGAWSTITIFGVVAGFMLIEIALLSGAAFMVGARQQQRALAVLASVGADRRVLRTSVASAGLVLGATGTVIGIGLGLVVAWGYMAATGDGSTTKYYGFDANPFALGVLAIVAVLAAWISAAIPARSVSRFDVVAALRGARRPVNPSRFRSAVGIIIVICGAATAAMGGALLLVAGTENPPGPFVQWAGPSLLVCGSVGLQLGAILGLPALLRAVAVGMARVGSGARLASRDLARNGARSVPAVAVVMTTAFVGVFLIAIYSGSEAQAAAQYSWSAPLRSTIIQFETDQGTGQLAPRLVDARTASDYAHEADRVLATTSAHVIMGAPDLEPLFSVHPKPTNATIAGPRLNSASACLDSYGAAPNCQLPQFLSTDGTGAKLIAASPAELAAMLGQQPTAAALRTLKDGGAVTLYPEYLTGKTVTIDWWTQKQIQQGDNSARGGVPKHSTTLTAVVDPVPHPGAFGVVISPQTAAKIGVTTVPRFILATPHAVPTTAQQDALNAYIDERSGAGRQSQADLSVELGPMDNATSVAWVIVAIAAFSTLGAAVIALSLARIDGRRDEYTLVAIGARPRTQRLIAFWQAFVLTSLGSIIGAAFALIPTGALAYSHAILFAPPWAALGTSVVGVPILIALVAAALRRASRSAAPDRSLVG